MLKWKRVGGCGVDSGQIMICDPTYIDGEWRKTDDCGILTRIFKDKQTGKRYAYAGFGFYRPGNEDVQLFANYEQPLDDYGGKTPNQCNAEGLWEADGWDRKPDKIGDFSYAGCCQSTLYTEHGFAQLRYRMGHAGAGVVMDNNHPLGPGVVTRTESGDGHYPVLALMNSDESGVCGLYIDFTVRDYKDELTPEEILEQLAGEHSVSWGEVCRLFGANTTAQRVEALRAMLEEAEAELAAEQEAAEAEADSET